MAFLGQTFAESELPQGNGGNYDPLPPGWYTASITQAELKSTAAGDGQYIKLRYDIIGPTHQGRVVFGNLNIKNASAKAEEIGRQQLGEIMRAIGLARVQDTDQLIGASLQVKLDVRPARTDEKTGKTYEASNDVKGFKAITRSDSGGGSSFPNFESSAPKAESKKVPWTTKKFG
jgi:hypothetical protein